MKKIFIAFVAAACMLGSCSDDDNTTENTGRDQISVSSTEVPVGPDGGAKEITVTSSGDWRLAGVCDWAHPSAVSGKNGQVVTFVADPNTTGSSKEATFKFFTGAAVTTFKIISEPEYTLELLSETEASFSPSANSLQIKLNSNIENLTTAFSDGGADWIAFDRRIDAFGKTVLSFSLAENETYDSRSSVVTISGLDMSVNVKVTQLQVDAILLDQTSFNLEASGATVIINLDTNVDYIVDIPSKYASWIHRVENKNMTRGLVKHTETFTVDPAKMIRSGEINFKKADGSYSQTVKIRQNGSEHIYVTIPDEKFRTWLINNNYVVNTEGAKCELTQNGLDATSFNCSYKNIESFEGIVAFANLTSLNCTGNPAKLISMGDLKITSLEIGYNYTRVPMVVVTGTNLTSINASAHYTQALDVSECPALATLNISYCYNLKTLYLKTGQTIQTIKDSAAGSSVGGYKIEYK